MGEIQLLEEWRRKVAKAKHEAHTILAIHEAAKSRVIILEDFLKNLSGLPIDIQDYFQEAATCLETNSLRAAIVLSWAGFFHTLSESLITKHKTEIHNKRPSWKFRDVVELKESVSEAHILDVAKEVGHIKRANLRIYQGQLATRNQCAHPTLYRPSLNEAVGYVDQMLRQTTQFI